MRLFFFFILLFIYFFVFLLIFCSFFCANFEIGNLDEQIEKKIMWDYLGRGILLLW